MKKKITVAVLALLILMIVSVVAIAITFSRPGVHSILGYTKVDFSEKVYFIEENSKEILGSSTLSISGMIRPTKSDGTSRPFRGDVRVDAYPLTEQGSNDGFFASRTKNIISISNLSAESSYPCYRFQASSDNPQIYSLIVYLEDGSTVMAYPGETEEEALANYDRFWKSFRE